ncbi:hypothetical protein [Saccharothrix sp.]|uniref:hypothetical protein n=1 Tax=Saccharothrix sp. TaxID=1873460 RepID=UPI0028113EB8|nr:hypothetical protein [Saccharothrix sp.]
MSKSSRNTPSDVVDLPHRGDRTHPLHIRFTADAVKGTESSIASTPLSEEHSRVACSRPCLDRAV